MKSNKAASLLQELLACCELNLDEMEPRTRQTIRRAEQFLKRQSQLRTSRVYAVALRQSSDEHTAAIVSCLRNHSIKSPGDLLKGVIHGVSDWVEETSSGRGAWTDSYGDFNIGDLGDYQLNDSPLAVALLHYGVADLRVEIVCEADDVCDFSWDYDTVLVAEETRKKLEATDVKEGD